MTSESPEMTASMPDDQDRLFATGDQLMRAMPVRFQAAIGRAAHAFASGDALEQVLSEIILAGIRTLESEIGVIRRITDDGQNFVVASASGPAPLSISGLMGSFSVVTNGIRQAAPGATIPVDLRLDHESTVLTSNDHWEFEHIGGRHLLIVPLYSSGVLVGRLDLVRTTDNPFSRETRDQVAPFAALAAGAIRDDQLRHVTEESQVFQTVLRLHQSVEQLADPETILQAVVELILREPGCARCYALLWNQERAEFVPTAVAGLDPHLVDILKLITLSPQVVPAFDQMIHSSRPLVIADATKSTLLPASLVRALGIRAAMIVPLRGRRHQTTGVLLLDQSEEGIQFTDDQVSMMAGMAKHLSILIENAILFEEVRSSSDSMSMINEIAIQLAMLTDEESLFRQLYYQVASVLDASRFGMALVSRDRRSLDIRVAVDGEILPPHRHIPASDSPLSTVAFTGRPELQGIRSGADTREWLPGAQPADQSHSHLTVPITVGRSVIGALTIQSTFRNAYGPRDKELLGAIALHTGIAIENARLYRIVRSRGDRRAVVLDQVMHRQELERKELVDDIHDDTLQTLAASLYRLDQALTTVSGLNEPEPALTQINDVRKSIADNIDRLRRRVFELRPATLDRLGLAPAIRELLERFNRENDVVTELNIDLPNRLSPEDETLVYRLVQEAIDHAKRSNGVTTISVGIRLQSNNILLAIFDDGIHAEASRREDAGDDLDVELMALIERADLAGGHARVSRRASGGTLVQITLPCHVRDQGGQKIVEERVSDHPVPHSPTDATKGIDSAGI